ncbi:uncharacterized protein DSM5745_08627 [Aspergillus mulundensis]|uniref:F-box domain-containing protein n=1 Tax=Aspergillus mulundensis TaxID=1810919 RepID=A0A3D8R4F9_9EURO|nr:Uncharacterized protein DSM5745_08627 [Aspergillus mulundensis]RDW68867.1 Uncharacterized protein DSM5745_08627 [Aspergillus mulundensis]
MTKPTAPKESPKESFLEALPVELLVHIFRNAPSFKDASNLALCSNQLYAVWCQHLIPICNEIAPACVPNYSALRQLLADVGKLPLHTQPSTIDQVKLILDQSSSRRKGLLQWYNVFVDNYERRDPQTPNELSPTEERRYVGGMYQLIGLLSIDKTTRQQRIKDMDLKTLFSLSDYTCLIDPYLIPELDFTVDENLGAAVENNPVSVRSLQIELRRQRNKFFNELYDHKYHPKGHTPYEEGGRYSWWCDCQQETFKSMLTGRVFSEEGAVSKVREDLWYDSEAE